MSKQKETRVKETPNFDPDISGFEFNDRLALPKELKEKLKEKGLDFRFINAQEFRRSGHYHRSHWRPLSVSTDLGLPSAFGANAQGEIQRGDLILGVRPKAVTAKHRAFLEERRRRYSNFNKSEAEQLRKYAKQAGLGDQVGISEGYEENDKGYKSVEDEF